jgi:hypothetical protein
MQRYSGFFARDRVISASIPIVVILVGQCLVLSLAVFVHHRMSFDDALAAILYMLPVYALIGFIMLVQQQRKTELTTAGDPPRQDA